MRWIRLWAIVLKEFRQLRRDRLTLGMILGIPTLQLLLFGFAINLDVRHIAAAYADFANTAQSREVIAQLSASGVIDFAAPSTSAEALQERIRRGEIAIGIVIPEDFDRRLIQLDRPAMQIMVDGSDQSMQAAARQLTALPLPLPGARVAARVEMVNFYNPDRRAPVNTVPGLIGVILTMSGVMFSAIALVREREKGNIEMLMATPVSPWELTIGKVLPFMLIGVIQVTVVLLLGRWVFDVPVRGQLIDVYAGSLLFIFANLSLGILLSTIASSQFQAMQLAFFTFLPQILMSGFMFPFAGMPGAAQYLAQLMPMTHFVRFIRGVMLRAAPISDFRVDLLALAVIAVALLSISTLRIRKSLD